MAQKENPGKETPVIPPEHPVTKPDTVPGKEKIEPLQPGPEIVPVPAPEIVPEPDIEPEEQDAETEED